MEHLLSVMPDMLQKIHTAKRILLLSDYDGTLTPIVERPEMALLSPEVKQVLTELAHNKHFILGIISGRSLPDLKQMVSIENIVYAGNHGFEIEGPGLIFINPITEELKPLFRIIRQVLIMALSTFKGVFIEDKGVTLSVHYRQAKPEHEHSVKTTVENIVNAPVLAGKFKITHGKKVFEVRPAVNWHKGKAIQLLMKKYGRGGWHSGLLPIYMGDDLTDEDGFKMIEKYGHGISIFIGENNMNSAAQYYLKSSYEVTQFLNLLVEHTQRGLVCEQFLTI